MFEILQYFKSFSVKNLHDACQRMIPRKGGSVFPHLSTHRFFVCSLWTEREQPTKHWLADSDAAALGMNAGSTFLFINFAGEK